jgi:erythromycin esterase-like protein
MKRSGTVNIGQLAREQMGEENIYLVGFGSYRGSVIAGEGWGASMKRMRVPEARKDSVEARLHAESTQNRYLLFGDKADRQGFHKPVPHRAIGVVYHPEHERMGNYVPSVMPERYNAFIYLDETKALHPLHLHPEGHKTPDTYPFGV